MAKKECITGNTYGRLTAVEYVCKSVKGRKLWLFSCSCGNTLTADISSVKSGNTQSCGCLHREGIIKRNTKHSKSHLPEYKVWKEIKKRCYNKNNKRYQNYGGCGIVMSDEWKDDFDAFFEHVGEKPQGKFSIGRIDNTRGYYPGNVRWETDIEQARNHSLQSNNSTGVTGIGLSKEKYYTATVSYTVDGKKVTKTRSFSIAKYGKIIAFDLAIKARQQMLYDLSKDGVIFSDTHGVKKHG